MFCFVSVQGLAVTGSCDQGPEAGVESSPCGRQAREGAEKHGGRVGAAVCLGLPSTGPLHARPARPAGRRHSTLYSLQELRSRFCGHPVRTQDLGLQQRPSREPSCCLLGPLPAAHQHRLQRKHSPWASEIPGVQAVCMVEAGWGKRKWSVSPHPVPAAPGCMRWEAAHIPTRQGEVNLGWLIAYPNIAGNLHP